MESTAFLEKLKELTSQEDVLLAGREVNELGGRFEDYMIEEERKLQIAQLDAQEKGEEVPEKPELAALKEAFHTELKEKKNHNRNPATYSR